MAVGGRTYYSVQQFARGDIKLHHHKTIVQQVLWFPNKQTGAVRCGLFVMG